MNTMKHKIMINNNSDIMYKRTVMKFNIYSEI